VAKIAFAIAGATGVVAGSPSPTGVSVLERTSTSISSWYNEKAPETRINTDDSLLSLVQD
jgi:hypothetical protein